jgi:hypothetical protein
MSVQWFQARLRWAVMADGEGLRGWQESTVLLRSRNEEEAFEQALRFGRRREGGREEDGRFVGLRLTEVVALDRIGAVIPDEFEVAWERRLPPEPLPDDYQFAPEQRTPAPSF